MSSDFSHINTLNSIVIPRNKILGFNLNDDQSSIAAPSNLKSEIIIIPSVSQPTWGSYFIFDVRERNCIISDIIINFNVDSFCPTSMGCLKFLRDIAIFTLVKYSQFLD